MEVLHASKRSDYSDDSVTMHLSSCIYCCYGISFTSLRCRLRLPKGESEVRAWAVATTDTMPALVDERSLMASTGSHCSRSRTVCRIRNTVYIPTCRHSPIRIGHSGPRPLKTHVAPRSHACPRRVFKCMCQPSALHVSYLPAKQPLETVRRERAYAARSSNLSA